MKNAAATNETNIQIEVTTEELIWIVSALKNLRHHMSVVLSLRHEEEMRGILENDYRLIQALISKLSD